MNSDFKPVLTKAALALQHKQNEFKALVFEEPKSIIQNDNQTTAKRKGQTIKDEESLVNTSTNTQESAFDIRIARREVLKFAINNQRKEKQKKKMIMYDMAQRGLKVPKKPYKNYKLLLDERKRLKQIREERRKFHQLGKTQTGLAAIKCRSKTKLEKQNKKRYPVSAIDQPYGIVPSNMKKKNKLDIIPKQ